jgi:membrane protease YdiL (CAAX protease family)
VQLVDTPPPALDAPAGDALRPPAPPRPRPSALRFFAVVVALFVVPGALVQSLQPILGLVWSELAALLLPAIVAAAGSNLRPSAALLLARRPTAAQWSLAVGVGVSAFAVAVALSNLWIAVLPERLVHRFDLAPLFEGPPLARGMLTLVAVTVAPFCEEAAFRGFILTALRTRHTPGSAIVVAAVLFAAMHLDPVRFPTLFVLGAAFGWLAWRAGSLWPAVVAHAVNNGIAAALTMAGVEESAPAPHAAPREALALFVPAAVLLGTTAALYRRATPSPPSVEDALIPRDPGDPDLRYDARRLGPGVRRAIVAAIASFVAIAALGLARR